jgi:hypothetical protein
MKTWAMGGHYSGTPSNEERKSGKKFKKRKRLYIAKREECVNFRTDKRQTKKQRKIEKLMIIQLEKSGCILQWARKVYAAAAEK